MNVTSVNNYLLHSPQFKSLKKEGQTFSDFNEYNKRYKITSNLPDIIKDSNCVGEGRSNKVYKLPNTDKFILKVYKKLSPEYIRDCRIKLTQVEDIFTKINVGQAVARMGDNILFLIKQDGLQHSIPFVERNNITQTHVTKYLSDINNLSKMPNEAYKNFTDEVKELTDKNCYIDYFNSNNLMITPSEINIVDIVKIKRYKQRIFMFPSKESLMKILLDDNVLPIILQKLSKQQKLELGNGIKIIEEKIDLAMKKSNLPKNKILTEVIDFLSDNLHHGKNKYFKTALKLLK